VVADTGSWLPGRQVLISPHAFGSFYQDGKVLLVNLNRNQIEHSPSIESHKTVSANSKRNTTVITIGRTIGRGIRYGA